jgi:hypothetical protein
MEPIFQETGNSTINKPHFIKNLRSAVNKNTVIEPTTERQKKYSTQTQKYRKTMQYKYSNKIYCDVDGATGSWGHVNSAFRRVTSRTPTTPIITQRSINVHSSNVFSMLSVPSLNKEQRTLFRSSEYWVTSRVVSSEWQWLQQEK